MRKVIVLSLVIFIGFILPVYAIDIVKIASMTYSLKSSRVTVTNAVTAIPATALAGRESITIRNLNASTTTIYVGGSDVVTSNGFPLDSSIPAFTWDFDDSVVVYGIVTAGTASVSVLEAK